MSFNGYLGLFIDKDNLEDIWEPITKVPLLPFTYAHHTTLVFNPTDEEVAKFVKGFPVFLSITGFAYDERVQAFTLAPVPGFPSKNRHPHITIACAADVKPAESNALLEKSGPVLLATPFVVTATSGHFINGKANFG